MGLNTSGLSGFVDKIVKMAFKKPKSLGAGISQILILTEIIQPIIDDLAKQIDAEAVALAKREWKKIVLKHHKKEDKQQVVTVASLLGVVDEVLADADGAAGWMPERISNEMSRQMYHAIRSLALPKKGHSTRGRFSVGPAGRPKKGSKLGQLVWHRLKGSGT